MGASDSSFRIEPGAPRFLWLIIFLLGWFGAFFASAPFEAYHAVMFGVAGLLMIVLPPAFSIPRTWLLLAGLFFAGSALVFLPQSILGPFPVWRAHLEELGVSTGHQIVVQAPQALEMWLIFGATMAVGLWLAGHRASPSQIRQLSLFFTAGVALYAVFSELTRNSDFIPRSGGHFGFFPNRNHSGTYLAMGAVVGIGAAFQAIRERRMTTTIIAFISAGLNFWAVAGWSISRGGLLLAGLGSVLWLASIGPKYLGRNGRRAMGLASILVLGAYFLADSNVRQRFENLTGATAQAVSGGQGKGEDSSAENLDGRVPIALDALKLIQNNFLTGVGGGQFEYVIPLFRNRTRQMNDGKLLHPESDWLWMASEAGVPATLCLLSLVIAAVGLSFRETVGGRDRAVRLGCLIAACLVAIHGIFDVPGHRLALAWTAAFLFAISFRRCSDAESSPPRAWPFRLLGFCILLFAGRFAWGAWFQGPLSATEAADRGVAEAETLYLSAVDHQGGLTTGGVSKLLSTIEVAKRTAVQAPLDYRSYGLAARADLFFPDHWGDASKAFAVESALNPQWVKIPFLQGKEWAGVQISQSIPAWQEALRRAAAADEIYPQGNSLKRTMRDLDLLARQHPQLRNAVEEVMSPYSH